MRPSRFLVAATLTLAAQASWFSSSSSEDPAYASWSPKELRAWLEVHNVPLPEAPTQADLMVLVEEKWDTASAWTYDQYASAQKSFSSLRDTAFDTWDESRLREFLLEYGVVAPKGPKEHLVLLVKQKYKAYDNAASSYASRASASASTIVYGDTKQQMSKSVSSVASQATSAASEASKDAARAFDDSKDYVYSTWDDNQIRTWLEDRGVIKTKSQLRRDELLQKMNDAWGKVANPVWEAWSTSYIHDWLVSHNIIKSDFERTRDALTEQMKNYYYSTTDTVYSSWTDSYLKQWLVQQGIMKSDAEASRDKMLKMVEDNYLSAKDTFWSAWSDNSIRDWLIENDYMRSGAQVKRDELIKLANDKWNDQVAKTAAYLTWPDARLRAYLREHGIDDKQVIAGPRPVLLQETRIRWVQTQTRADNLYSKFMRVVKSRIYKVVDALHRLFSLFSGEKEPAGGWEETKRRAGEGYEKATNWASESAEKVKVGGQTSKGEL